MAANLALDTLGAEASADGYNYTRVPAQAIDGESSTGWEAADNTAGHWLAVDLGQPAEIEQIYLWQSATASAQVGQLAIAYSLNGTDWTTFYVETQNKQQAITVDFNAITARFWRVTSTTNEGGKWWVYTFAVNGQWPTSHSLTPLPIPVDSSIEDVIQHVWDEYYQDTFTALDSLFPTWDYNPMDCWHIAFHVFVAKMGLISIERTTYPVATDGTDLSAVEAALDDIAGDVYTTYTAMTSLIGTPTDDLATDIDGLVDRIGNVVTAGVAATSDDIENAHTATDALITNLDGDLVSHHNNNIQLHADTRSAAQSYANTAGAATTAAIAALLALDAALPLALQAEHDATQVAIATLYDAEEALSDLLQAVSGLSSAASGGFPGLANVTLGTPVVVTAPTYLDGPLDGVLITVNTAPAGQSKQVSGGVDRYKGLGWVSFKSDAGFFEPLQTLQNSLALFEPTGIISPSGVTVFVKAGSSLTVTPYTKD